MARPFKQGLQYFPFDVNFFEDDRIQDLFTDFGYLGQIIYIRILTLVYSNGYYLEQSLNSLSRRIFRDFQCQWLTTVDRVKEVIHACAKLGLFDESLMFKDVITSASIQKQFIISTKKRKDVDTTKYWLLTEKDMLEAKIFLSTNFTGDSLPQIINDGINGVNGDNNSDNDTINSQKKRKRKKK